MLKFKGISCRFGLITYNMEILCLEVKTNLFLFEELAQYSNKKFNVLIFFIIFIWDHFLFDWFEYSFILFIWAIFRYPYYVWFLICKFVSPLSLIDDISVTFIQERYNYLTCKQSQLILLKLDLLFLKQHGS